MQSSHCSKQSGQARSCPSPPLRITDQELHLTVAHMHDAKTQGKNECRHSREGGPCPCLQSTSGVQQELGEWWQRDATFPKQQSWSRAIVGKAADGLSKSHKELCVNREEACGLCSLVGKGWRQQSQMCTYQFCTDWEYLLSGSSHPQLDLFPHIPFLPELALGSAAQAGRRNVCNSAVNQHILTEMGKRVLFSSFLFFILQLFIVRHWICIPRASVWQNVIVLVTILHIREHNI